MTKLHYQVMQALLPVLLEVTKGAREKAASASEIDLDEVKLERLVKQLKEELNRSFAEAQLRGICNILSAASGNSLYTKAYARMKKGNPSEERPIYEPLTVILFEENMTGHGYNRNIPVIVTHGIKGYCLSVEGYVDSNAFAGIDKPRIASDEEVEACLANLTTEQLKTIVTSDLFAPAMTALFEEVTPEPADPSVATEDGTIPPA